MKTILDRKLVTPQDVLDLSPAINAYVRGRIELRAMADIMSSWIGGKQWDLGASEVLSERILHWLKTHPPMTAKQIASAMQVKLDSVYHSLSRLEKRRAVECRRSDRPHKWTLAKHPSSNRLVDIFDAEEPDADA